MQFKRHNELEGLHAPFSPSQSSWLRYDDDKARQVYLKKQAARMGTRLHAWAKETIGLGIKQPRSKKTLSAYINDAIGFKMDTEVVLFYSIYFFGTADTISFRDNFLRIHDLKTGEHPASMEQLMIYAALFCLEYRVKPSDIEMELRIYQNDQIMIHNPTAEEIVPIMDHIIHLNKILENLEKEG
jgi:hypothetical protein